ncbi:MAG: hypothetical protein KJZ86_04380 [Caldilineaceae bacterium]|nr:hypothetical protein [Caldilineaceae bacterium]
MAERLGDLLALLGIGIVALLAWAALAPFEALGWWAGWFGSHVYNDGLSVELPEGKTGEDIDSFLVFLSGIAQVGGESLSRRERAFLEKLDVSLPHTIVVDDIFPYSVNNLPLTGQPVFARLWRWAMRRKFSDNWLERLGGYLINLRNIWQVGISIDHRYGPIYNQAMARVIAHGLARYGYDPERALPVFVVGYSGAGQIAVGAAPYLRELIGGAVYVILLGGIYGSDPGLLAVDRVYHLYGEQDTSQRLTPLLFPGRWPLMWYSDWNRAKRQGRIVFRSLGPMTHGGNTGYMTTSQRLSTGLTHQEATVQAIGGIVRENL